MVPLLPLTPPTAQKKRAVTRLVIHCSDSPDISLTEAVITQDVAGGFRAWHRFNLVFVGPTRVLWQDAQKWLETVGDIGADTIRSWHLEKGWSDIGYHDVIKRDGKREAGRPEEKMGAHTQGFNKGSLAACWVGRERPTPPQYAELVQWGADKCLAYALKPSDIHGHRELAPMSGKTCPGIDMDKYRADVTRRLTEMQCGTEVGK